VAKSNHIRYCGSPIPLSFDELSNDKQVLIVEFSAGELVGVTPMMVPRFQPMQVIKGDLQSIENEINELPDNDIGSSDELAIWLSIEVETQDYLNDLQQRIQALTKGKHVEVLQLRRARKQQKLRIEREDKEVLAELTPEEVFQRRLESECFEEPSEQERLIRIKDAFVHIVHELKLELDNED
jgi:exonuclease SbcD